MKTVQTIAAALALLALPGLALAQAQPVTPADTIHPAIHGNNGTGNNASPNGSNDGAGNRHGIGNNPGQAGINPNDDGVNGFRNQLNTVHGGILDITGKGAAMAKAKPDRVRMNGKDKGAICHIGEEVVVDELTGEPVIDLETGEIIVLQSAKVIVVPVKTAQKHVDKHGDFVIPYVTDAETGETALDPVTLAECAALDETVDEDDDDDDDEVVDPVVVDPVVVE